MADPTDKQIRGISGLVTTLRRSKLMSQVRGRGNRNTEVRLAKLLRVSGLRGWRRHLKLPGTPDFCFKLRKVAIFVDGCFWHGCPGCYTSPRRNSTFWVAKVTSNRARDKRVNRLLRSLGWKVLRLWEC